VGLFRGGWGGGQALAMVLTVVTDRSYRGGPRRRNQLALNAAHVDQSFALVVASPRDLVEFVAASLFFRVEDWLWRWSVIAVGFTEEHFFPIVFSLGENVEYWVLSASRVAMLWGTRCARLPTAGFVLLAPRAGAVPVRLFCQWANGL